MERSHRRACFVGIAAATAAFLALVLGEGMALGGPFEDGMDFFGGGHYRWALEKFIEAVDQAPRDPQRVWFLAESYRMLGDTPAATHVYRQVLRMSPQSPLGVASRQALEMLGEPTVAVVSMPIQRRGTSILVPARVNGQSVGVFILDTGATYTSLSTVIARQLGVSTTGTSTVRLATANGAIQAPLALLDEVDIGGAIAKHVATVVHDLPGMPPGIVGLLGMSFLERFRMNLDISSGLLTFESGN